MKLFHNHIGVTRVYANYWKFGNERKLEEVEVVKYLLRFLESSRGWTTQRVSSSISDPPDCCDNFADGRQFGIEVTELVDSAAAEEHEAVRSHRERKLGALPRKTAGVAIFNSETLQSELVRICHRKDRPSKVDNLEFYALAIFSDEEFIEPHLVEFAISSLSVTTCFLDAAYLILSYTPSALKFTDCIPVYEISLIRENKQIA